MNKEHIVLSCYFEVNSHSHFSFQHLISLYFQSNKSRTDNMTEKKQNVDFMIKTHINKTKTVWRSKDENDMSEWDKFQNWKIWSSFRKEMMILKTLIKTLKLTELLHAERKLKSMIFRFVRCTNIAFEIFV